MENSISDIHNFTQSQSHGLFWDSEIREKCFDINAKNCRQPGINRVDILNRGYSV